MYADIQILYICCIYSEGQRVYCCNITINPKLHIFILFINVREFITKFWEAKTKRYDHLFVQEAVFITLNIFKTNKSSY